MFNVTALSVTCTKPIIDSGSVTPDTATITVGVTYTVLCSTGYSLSGDNEVTCGNDGELSTLPTCILSEYLVQ